MKSKINFDFDIPCRTSARWCSRGTPVGWIWIFEIFNFSTFGKKKKKEEEKSSRSFLNLWFGNLKHAEKNIIFSMILRKLVINPNLTFFSAPSWKTGKHKKNTKLFKLVCISLAAKPQISCQKSIIEFHIHHLKCQTKNVHLFMPARIRGLPK